MGSSMHYPSTDSGTSMPIESVEESISSMQLTRSAPLQGRLAPPSQLIRVFDRREGAGRKGKEGGNAVRW